MARRKRVFGSGRQRTGAGAGVFIEDEASPVLGLLATNFPNAADRAVRHVAFEVHKAVKSYFRRDGHGRKLSEVQRLRTADKIRRSNVGRRLRRKNYAGDINKDGKGLERAVNFEHFKGRLKAITGWASADANGLTGRRFQGGSQVIVTEKMKRFFAASASKARGVQKVRLLKLAAMRVGKVIKNPGRPVFDPVYNRMRPVIPVIMEKRIERNIGLITNEAYIAILTDLTAPEQNLQESRKRAI